ncbi:MAG: c-type cytochrome, partial [Planctomycetota bacterium]
MIRSWVWGVTIALGITPSLCASDTDAEARHFAEQIKPLFAKHCQSCHGGEKPKGDLRVESLSQDFAERENRKRWLAVLEQVKAGTMPPKEKPRPPAEEVKILTDWISKHAAAAEAARSAAQGRVVLRRLNRAEYQNTVRDLLGVEV